MPTRTVELLVAYPDHTWDLDTVHIPAIYQGELRIEHEARIKWRTQHPNSEAVALALYWYSDNADEGVDDVLAL